MTKKISKRLMNQKIALVVGLTFILGLAVWMMSTVVIEAPRGEFQEGVHYQLIENPRRIHGDSIEVMEFFSYACVHCYNFDPDMSAWARENEARVRFIRTPLSTSELWTIYARTYYTMAELGILEKVHYPFFVQIHGVRQNLSDLDSIANWIDGKGTSSEEFTRKYHSATVSNRLQQSDRLQRRLKIANVPTLVVNGKYLVTMNRNVGPSRMPEVLDYLVQKELNAGSPEAEPDA